MTIVFSDGSEFPIVRMESLAIVNDHGFLSRELRLSLGEVEEEKLIDCLCSGKENSGVTILSDADRIMQYKGYHLREMSVVQTDQGVETMIRLLKAAE